MVNTFQEQMRPPMIGIGQSFGGYPIVQAALMHPRLFTALVALEPYLVAGGENDNFASRVVATMMKRRDGWESREEARISFLKNRYYAAFDPEVFEKVMANDLRVVQRLDGESSVTLVTSKAMEAATMMRMKPSSKNESVSNLDYTGSKEQSVAPGLYRPEPAVIQHRLSELQPATLYVFGSKSPLAYQGLHRWLVANTGTGPGGSGGAKRNMASDVVVEDARHPMPPEKPRETAEAMVPWIMKQVKFWHQVVSKEIRKDRFWTTEVNPKWVKAITKCEKL